MLIRSFPAGAFGTNCYAVASGPGAECVVVDPGMEAVEPLRAVLAADGLKPVAVVLTHGHLDHTASVLPVCDGYDIPAWLHPEDLPFPDQIATFANARYAVQRGEFLVIPTKREPMWWRMKRFLPGLYFRRMLKLARPHTRSADTH